MKPLTDLEADLKLKEKARQKLALAGQPAPGFKAHDPLLAFLKIRRAKIDEISATIPFADFTRHNPELGITGTEMENFTGEVLSRVLTNGVRPRCVVVLDCSRKAWQSRLRAAGFAA